MAELVCPHCGHVLGELAEYQVYEYKVAQWLNGKVAPGLTPGFDVFQCEELGEATIQVKYSNAVENRLHGGYVNQQWFFRVSQWNDAYPDFFVLFGLDKGGKEHCFLFDREDFSSSSCAWSKGRGRPKTGRILRMAARSEYHFGNQKKSIRYCKFWDREVLDPERDLAAMMRIVWAINRRPDWSEVVSRELFR